MKSPWIRRSTHERIVGEWRTLEMLAKSTARRATSGAYRAVTISQNCANAKDGCPMQVDTALNLGVGVMEPRECVSCTEAKKRAA